MVEYLNGYWLFGAGGLLSIALGAASWMGGLPHLMKIASDLSGVVAPLATGASNGIVYLVRDILFEGAKDILDSATTVMTVALIIAGTSIYVKHAAVSKEQVICTAKVNAAVKKASPKGKVSPAKEIRSITDIFSW